MNQNLKALFILEEIAQMGEGSSRITLLISTGHEGSLWWLGIFFTSYAMVITVTWCQTNSTANAPQNNSAHHRHHKNGVHSSSTVQEHCRTNAEVAIDGWQYKGKFNMFILTHGWKMIGVYVCVEKDVQTRGLSECKCITGHGMSLAQEQLDQLCFGMRCRSGIFWLALHLHVLNTNTCLQI